MASRVWTTDELDELRRLWRTMPAGAVAARLERTTRSVSNRASKLGLTKFQARTPGRPWSICEVDVLIQLWPTTPDVELAKRLGRTAYAIELKGRSLGLPPRLTLGEIARTTGYHRGRVRTAAARIGVVFRRLGDKYICSPEQAERIIEHLASIPDGCKLHVRRTGEWGIKPGAAKACIGCGTNERRRWAHDMCRPCLDKSRDWKVAK